MTLQNGTLEEFGYQWINNARNGGGTYATDYYPYPWRLILHEIQGGANPGMISGHAVPPHIWYDPISRAKYQTVPLNRSAFALYQGDQTHYTNKACALQCEIAGFTGYGADETDQMLLNIAEDVVVPFVLFVRSQGSDIDLSDCPAPPGNLHGTASEYWSGRMGDQRWADFSGLASHLWTPGNDHWDTGAMDVPRIARYATELLGGNLGTASIKEMFTVAQFDDLMAKLTELMAKLTEILAVSRQAAIVQDNQHTETRGRLDKALVGVGEALAVSRQAAVVQDNQHVETRTGINGSYANLNASLAVVHQKIDALRAQMGNAALSFGPAAADPGGGPSRIQGFASAAAADDDQPTVEGRQMHALQRQKAQLEAQIEAATVVEPPENQP